MGKYGKLRLKAENLRNRMEMALGPINEKLQEVIGDDSAAVIFQPGDGWVVSWGHDHNSAGVDFDLLFSMSEEDAVSYLLSTEV